MRKLQQWMCEAAPEKLKAVLAVIVVALLVVGLGGCAVDSFTKTGCCGSPLLTDKDSH